MDNKGALATLNDDAAIEQIASGILSKNIAALYGVTPYAVRKRLAKHPDYQAAVQEQAESFVEQALHEVMECPLDQVAIARARVRFDCAHKWAASRDPVRWGARPAVQMQIGAQAGEQPGQASGITVIFVTAPQQNAAPIDRCIDSESQVIDANGKHV